MDAVDAARDALNTVVAKRLTPEQREACVYEKRTQSIVVSGNKPLGGAGPWVVVRARSGKDIPKRYTSPMLAAANDEYRDACDEAERAAMDAFRKVCGDLHGEHFRAVVFAVHFCQTFEALRLHADAAEIKGWCVPEPCINHFPHLDESPADDNTEGGTDSSTDSSTDKKRRQSSRGNDGSADVGSLPMAMSLKAVTPYWMSREEGVSNDFVTDGMALLAAANMSGKSTLLRTITAACLLANCGLCVPADSAVVPAFDVIFLRNTAYDAPKEGKSSFGVEMSDIRDLLAVATPRSLVMVDELGKGTSSSEGAALSGAILEHFGAIGCYGVFASHLFELFELPMEVSNLELLTMEVIVHTADSDESAEQQQEKDTQDLSTAPQQSGVMLEGDGSVSDGVVDRRQRRVEWTYRVKAGQADSSLALDAARHFDVPASILDRAHELLANADMMRQRSLGVPTAHATVAAGSTAPTASPPPPLSDDSEHNGSDDPSERDDRNFDHSEVVVYELGRLRGEVGQRVKTVLPKWTPPPRSRMRSVVYAFRVPDGRWYVGETDDVSERIEEHRRSDLKRNATFHYVGVPSKSEATSAEAKLIATLLGHGVPMLSSRDAGRTRTSAGRGG
jgi:hypothetical protein